MAISLVTSYSQNFDTLAISGTMNTLLPNGWALTETGGGARDNEAYAFDDGGSNTGDTYSYGVDNSTDRAFGGLQSGTLIPVIGAEFVNGTGSLLTSLLIAYTGEQWRLGTAARADRIDFQISTNATSLTTGTWVDVNALDFSSPNTTVTGQLDGNAAANRTAISSTITSLSIADGATFWIRWTDFNASGSDDGLAVDDFSITAAAGPAPVLVTIAASDADASETGANAGTFRVSRTGDVTSGLAVTFDTSGNASAGDYTPALGASVLIPAGASFVDITITPVDDSTAEGPETLTLTLTDGAQYDLGTPAAATVTIADNDAALTLISAIQGAGSTSPLAGQLVVVEAIVVGDFQGASGLSGFFLQEEDAQADGNLLTSEGIFVFQGASGTAVSVGDLVRVTATVLEFGTAGSTMTELTTITSLSVVSSGNPLPTAATLTFPQVNTSALESFEGMRVNVTTTLTVTDTFTLGRFGEVGLASDGPGNQPGTDARIDQYTQFNLPGVAGNTAYQSTVAPRLLIVDDASSLSNRDPIVYGRDGNPLTAANTLRGGDTVSSLSGILDDRFRTSPDDPYRVQPTATVDFDATNPRGPVPDVGGRLTVASLNVLNYFNGNGAGGGFPTSRGADSLAEFNRQRDKVIAAILGTEADVIGLLEIENDGYGALSAIQDLVNGLNAIAGAGTYAFVNPGTPALGGDQIAVGMLYKPAVVTLVGSAAVLDSTVDVRFNSSQQRPTLAQTFQEIATGALFTPVINHLKSKGSSAGAPGDADSGDGQGLSNATRTLAAEALVDWLAGDPTGQGDTDYLILGDLNAYAKEDPLRAIEEGADDIAGNGDDYTNLVAHSEYSYLFGGQWGALDHALGSASLGAQVSGATKWHINADEPTVLDYNVENKSANQQNTLYAPDAFRASDHDAVIVGLNLIVTQGGGRGDVLVGTAGPDRLVGGGARDLIVTGGGADTIVYNSVLDAYDVVMDFALGLDKLAVTTLLQSVGYSGSDPVGDGYLKVLAASPVDTVVLFDADGNAGQGAARPLVELVGVPAPQDPNVLFTFDNGNA